MEAPASESASRGAFISVVFLTFSDFQWLESSSFTITEHLPHFQGFEILDDVLKIRQEIVAERFGEDQSWARPKSNAAVAVPLFLGAASVPDSKSQPALESARHVTQVPHSSSSSGLSPNGLDAPVKAATAASDTEGVGFVPPLTETPCSLPLHSCKIQTPSESDSYQNQIQTPSLNSNYPNSPSHQFQNQYSEPDNRDWRGRSGQPFGNADERSWDNLKENREFGNNRQEQLNSQFSRSQITSNQGILITGRNSRLSCHGQLEGELSEKDRVLKTAKGSGTVSLMLQGTPKPGSCGCTGPSLVPCSYTLISSPHNQFYPTNTTVNALPT
ncbi:hypothetical protein V8G54_025705 [Vigna mungo]|uniref:Uncharacterized protein n=1 Tax=Vigna mungo TaxID=3915 RepID=A0AAQ3MZ06_VIGMU